MENSANNFQKELDDLKKIDSNQRRSAFLEYCKKKITLEENNKLNIGEASNRICGACSLCFQEIMPEFEEVMNIACDLELPENYRDRAIKDWDKLKEIIKNKK